MCRSLRNEWTTFLIGTVLDQPCVPTAVMQSSPMGMRAEARSYGIPYLVDIWAPSLLFSHTHPFLMRSYDEHRIFESQ